MTKRIGLGEGETFQRSESLGYIVNYLGRLFARALERRLARHGVALGQFPLLLALWEEDGLTQSEIARRLSIEQPTVANTVKRMERDGLVRAAADPSNRRRVLIYLTEKGHELEAPLIADAKAVNAIAESALTSDEATMFKKMTRQIAARLSRVDKESGGPTK